jgi:AcrR family transcriptional regulator
MAPAQGPGRPRSETARQAILSAALELARTDGYHAATIKGIAGQAGVGRQTVYRWWATKAEIMLEAITEFTAAAAQWPPSGDALADMRRLFRDVLGQSRPLAPVVAGLLADAIADPGFSARVRERLLTRRREIMSGILAAGQASGQLPAGYPVDLAIDVVSGLLWYRILSGPQELDTELAADLTETLLRLGGQQAAGPEPADTDGA